PEQCRSTRPRSHASGLSSARRPVCDHGPLPQADHGPLPQRADAPTDTDSHRHCAAVPLQRLPARGHLVPWVPARRLHTGNLSAVHLEGTSVPGAYPPGACAGASARFRGTLLLVLREKPTVISRRIVLGGLSRAGPAESCRARRIVGGPAELPCSH